MVTAWLQMMDDVIVKYGEPTWSSLVSALEEVGHGDIAARIKASGGQGGL